MFRLLNYDMQSFILKKLYRYRFLFIYIVIGFISILSELLLRRMLGHIINAWVAQALAVISGILLAFILNVRFNFKVPRSKRNRAFCLFLIISLGSFALNYLFRANLITLSVSYEASRLISSGLLFFIAYFLHRRFSFNAYKQVGIAVYADHKEDIKAIWEKIMYVGDFIHIDIVDKTFNANAPDPTIYRLEAVRAYWPGKEIHCHIMSRTPSIWLEPVIGFVDTVIIHYEIDEDIAPLLKKIKSRGKKVGLCLLLNTPVDVLTPYAALLDEVMLLTIPQPGQSGQKFDIDSLERIAELDRFPERGHFVICVDGGVNDQVIRLLQVEKVISGSYVLNSDNPLQRIMRLQTSSQYEAI